MSKIEWTERTWNPIAGCSVVSPGCTNCYAMRQAHRLAANPSTPHYAGTTEMSRGGPVWTGKIGVAGESAFLAPLWRQKPQTYFVNSMSDLFHSDVPDEVIDLVFAVMALCPQHTFQILTKRADRMRQYFEDAPFTRWLDIIRFRWRDRTVAELAASGALPNVWLGISAEDQRRADERVPELLATPAAVRFVSAEPLLGPVDLESAWHGESAVDAECWGDCAWCEKGFPALHNCQRGRQSEADWLKGSSGIDWVIVGGESGPGARPMHPDWVRSLRDQCHEAGTAFFFKQWGAWAPLAVMTMDGPKQLAFAEKSFRDASLIHIFDDLTNCGRIGKRAAGRLLDGRTWDEVPT
ncbi:Gp37Gp68 family protein [Roseivivax marinus]|uniref:Gp37Gp68 family protein n=1 Tax=Roseivivax marinus TaxID=1379903 RepID=W4HE89_9RHOB|nr:phage Gp37/Gp68 family protein [Roseivivax marinus]ETW11092.1 Gp37Gp68 family protein [Roseivivax marinus]